ncbi:MAG: fibrobacter succinogenes major paralogous domain-containing protein [Dysgonamonadaceae bacterium]|nr:fibrobacter succinogenes major paralogous domain-containing protein [Dysgonamonadaceae bacterium]
MEPSSVDYRDHRVSTSDATNDTDNYGSWFTWCMVTTHADILCPAPWRVPSQDDFVNYSGGGNNSAITGGTHESPGVDGWLFGSFANIGSVYDEMRGYYWSSTESSISSNYGMNANVDNSRFNSLGGSPRNYGNSLRCVK